MVKTMAFGDGENDIEMLNYVQIGVAMGNAENSVKENADYVTDSVDDNGIQKALVGELIFPYTPNIISIRQT